MRVIEGIKVKQSLIVKAQQPWLTLCVFACSFPMFSLLFWLFVSIFLSVFRVYANAAIRPSVQKLTTDAGLLFWQFCLACNWHNLNGQSAMSSVLGQQ
ncbi:hypothetical protein MJ923_07540 [Shewanella sp. 3B26]|uniref:Uncharacterized protein n=1 Tax=Shewanella zhuhaiensis TaxID=2919576 RepID=A0AAJ1FAJ6_9GAMM|nr:hypothetical protein [Shewanella zhuhaiensis]MCH4294155.1 hypothetical protein [Shewanella zhuhaiensis]